MQVPESWLRQFCNPDLSSEQIADRLTMAGLEVEDMQAAAPAFSGVVVGEVVKVEPHPNADRLRVCQVQVGQAEALQIVCGAPNVALGMKAPCALLGAVLPPSAADGKPLQITAATMRGVTSQGMLCSAKELGLSSDHAGLLALPQELKTGQGLRQALDLDDCVFTIKLTPNLGHCLSVLGVARELAAVTGTSLVQPSFPPVIPALDEVLPVRIEAAELCGRFSGRVIRGVNAQAPTPAWMRQRLERAGQRSISALVDISNYVMLELGRPSHVFDLDKIEGGLEVRWGRAGESLKLLNGQTVEVDAQVGVIAAGRCIESLAGIMGGDATAVSLDTRNVYVEAAFWWPDAVRGRARRYNFSTDAGMRFERGVDAATTTQHAEHITRLILDICGGQPGPLDDHILQLPEREPVRMRAARCERIMGMSIGVDRMADVFTRLGLPFQQEGSGADVAFRVTPPSYRFDLEIEEDLIEEVARIHGYANIPTVPPLAQVRMLPAPEGRRSQHALRELLAARAYQETINFSFAEPEWETDLVGNFQPIQLLNPIAAQASVMRSSLLGGLLQALRLNLSHKARRVRLFELGRVFMRDTRAADAAQPAGIAQPMRVGGLAYGPVWPMQWAQAERLVDFFDVKNDIEQLCAGAGLLSFEPLVHPALHPGRSAAVLLNGQAVGILGEVHPRWMQKYALPHAPVVFELDAMALQSQAMPTIRPVARAPAILRDLSFVMDRTIPAARILQVVRGARTSDARCGIVQDVELFDVFLPQHEEGKTRKSVALRLTLQAAETLTDMQADAASEGVIEAMRRTLGANLRN
ncbi:MAG: phenylalanine--tRNA ligase subunit beta [Thiomonas sp.]|uniref:Phenylalanine--tRNA ligase beta subunit n=1 Tax=mine drainage metagenome TaxID=410659 RepID=E6PRH0_9ZZZZ